MSESLLKNISGEGHSASGWSLSSYRLQVQKSVHSGNGLSLIDLHCLLLMLVSKPLLIVNCCSSGFSVSSDCDWAQFHSSLLPPWLLSNCYSWGWLMGPCCGQSTRSDWSFLPPTLIPDTSFPLSQSVIRLWRFIYFTLNENEDWPDCHLWSQTQQWRKRCQSVDSQIRVGSDVQDPPSEQMAWPTPQGQQ